ncbi:hypothetical protein T09_14561 [Trichinella sp. T9]|nr:hypothetical protein T09_14561 [Trichinella sp. T9]
MASISAGSDVKPLHRFVYGNEIAVHRKMLCSAVLIGREEENSNDSTSVAFNQLLKKKQSNHQLIFREK